MMQLTRAEWWTDRRKKYTKRLTKIALFTILLVAIFLNYGSNYIAVSFAITIFGIFFYLIYINLTNFIFIMLEFIDRQWEIRQIKEEQKSQLDFIALVAIIFQLLFPITYIWLLIEMFISGSQSNNF